MDLFSQVGFEGASIERIAARSGVARTTIYRRWSTREDLIIQALAEAAPLPILAGSEVKSLQTDELLQRMVRAGVDLLDPKLRKFSAHLIGALPDHSSLMRTCQEQFLLPRRFAFRTLLERARAIGVVPVDADVEMLMDTLSGAMLYRLLVQPVKGGPAKVRDYVLRLLRELGFRLSNAEGQDPR
jgi:AcrR family transcriptional regulator